MQIMYNLTHYFIKVVYISFIICIYYNSNKKQIKLLSNC